MGGEGFMFDANKSFKKNRGQLKKRIHKFNEHLRDDSLVLENYIVPKQEITAEERKVMEAHVQKIIARDRSVSLIRNTIIIGLALTAFIWLIIKFFSA